MKNQEVADVLYTIADLLDIKGEGFFVTRAYRMAAATIETLDENINTLVKQHRLQHIQGIGKALEQKITELVETEKLEYLQRLKQEIPIELLEFLKIPNLGPKKVAAIYTHLGIISITDLKQAVQEGKLRDLDGFGEITERNILRGIKLREQTSGRFLLHHAYEDGQRYLKYLKTCEHIQQLSLAGSLRRMKESIGDLDILACSEHPEKVMDFFVKYSDVDRILLKGSTKTSVILNDHMPVDIRVVEEKSFGSS